MCGEFLYKGITYLIMAMHALVSERWVATPSPFSHTSTGLK